MGELNSEPSHQPNFTVVGIGASAGGLAALQTFFDSTPADIGVAFVIVMHLSPEHQSHLPQLLQSHTKMPVTQVQNITEMVPDHVYVIPPNRNLSTIDTHLRLSELEESRQQRAPIDHFFRTLAHTHHEKAIGIVLSGTGSDGSVGLKQIKERGGLAIVQDPVEAEYDSMPQNAISTGLVDLVLAVTEMPLQIRNFVQAEPNLPPPEAEKDLPETQEDLLQKILTQLRLHAGHDFANYKRATVMRRVGRRMQLRQIDELGAYLQVLRKEPDELNRLFHDLLITVTNFFRDKEAFTALKEKVIPALLNDKSSEDIIRVWVVGCATGEEAYSIAILLLEHLSQLKNPPELQIFASDISEPALTRARNGTYPAAIEADVTPERLERYFEAQNGSYRVKAIVREAVLFTEHNVLHDPPFSRIDLVACRNLLIYLQSPIQSKIIELFHYALKPEGYLFVGSAESLGSAELFRMLDKKQGLYQRQAVNSIHPILPSLPLAPRTAAKQLMTLSNTTSEHTKPVSFGRVHERMVEQHAPPSMLVNEEFIIVHLSEHAGRFLHHPGGEPTNNVMQCILPPLRAELTMALYEAAERGRPFRTQPVSVTLDGEARQVSLSVHPATGAEMSGFVLIIFLEADDMAESGDKEQVGQATAVAVRELELELARTKERLQTTVEEFESSREEMRASNEELQSMNEELHSTAEELETSKEELQSINEELLTVNQEHRNKVEELSQLSGDLQNLLASSEVATLFLDRELCIRRFTPQVGELFNIMEADQGRPLSHITHKLEGNSLLRDAKGVLEKLTMIEREMRGLDDRHFLVRLRPYRSLEDRIDGVVIIFVNVTKMKQTEEQLRASNQFQQDIVHTVREGLLVLDLNLRVEFANESFYQMFEVPMTETEGTLVYELGNGQWDIPELRILLEDVLPDNTVFNDYEMTHEFEHIGKRIMRLNGRRLDGQQRILLAVEDITERQQALHELQQLTNKLETEVAQRTSRIRELASELLVAEQNVRQRIAEALHDDLQQFLYSMRMQLGMLKNTLTAEGKTEAAAPIEELDEMIQAAFKMTRQMAGELQPPVPVGEKLGESMRQLAAYIHELHLLEVDVTLHDDVTLPDENTRLLLFHIVRELLFNVVKHAAVDSARLEVKQEENMLKVSVRDAGKGFDAEGFLKNSKRTSLGLYSINERLKLLNGRIEIHSIVGDGTRVDIFIPLY